MISLRNVLSGALWMLGLAIGLATWSYARWWATKHGTRQRDALVMPEFIASFCAGLAIFSLGLALGSQRWWVTVAWAVLVVLSIAQGSYSWITRPRTVSPDVRPTLEQDETS